MHYLKQELPGQAFPNAIDGNHFPSQHYLGRFNGYDLSQYGPRSQKKVRFWHPRREQHKGKKKVTETPGFILFQVIVPQFLPLFDAVLTVRLLSRRRYGRKL